MTHTFTFRCDDGRLRDFTTETTSWEDMLYDFLEQHCSFLFEEIGLQDSCQIELVEEKDGAALEIIGAHSTHFVFQ